MKKDKKDIEIRMQEIEFGFMESFQKMVENAKKAGVLEGDMFRSKEN